MFPKERTRRAQIPLKRAPRKAPPARLPLKGGMPGPKAVKRSARAEIRPKIPGPAARNSGSGNPQGPGAPSASAAQSLPLGRERPSRAPAGALRFNLRPPPYSPPADAAAPPPNPALRARGAKRPRTATKSEALAKRTFARTARAPTQ